MARPARYRIVKNDFIALNTSITAGLPETRPAPMTRPDTAKTVSAEDTDSIVAAVANALAPAARSASSAVKVINQGRPESAQAESATVQSEVMSFGQPSSALQV